MANFNQVIDAILIMGIPFVLGFSIGVTATYLNFMRGVNNTLKLYNDQTRKRGYEPDGTDMTNVVSMKNHKEDK